MEVDFSTLVSVVSRTYSRKSFLGFSTLNLPINERDLSPFGHNLSYATYARKIKYRVPSTLEPGNFEERNEKVVLKDPGRHFNRDGSAVGQDAARALLMEIQHGVDPAVQPQLVLDFAEWTLEDLLSDQEDLSLETRLHIDLDMVNGLEVLHDCGLIHGNVIPKNILVRRLLSKEANSRSKRYSAQLANFEYSFLDDGVPRRVCGRTSGYVSPEALRGAEITDFKAVDIYSLGITIWRTTVPNASVKDLGNGDTAPVSEGNQTSLSKKDEIIPENIDSNIPFDEMLRHATSQSSDDRNLNRLKSVIQSYLLTESHVQGQKTHKPIELEVVPNTTININYPRFNHANGLVKDQIVSSLERISSDPGDTRNPRALYELGLSHLSKFGDPNKLNDSLGIRCILQAAGRGEILAKANANRLFDACSASSDMTSNGLVRKDQWLLDAAVEGFEEMEVIRHRWRKGRHYTLNEEVREFKKQVMAWSSDEDPLVFQLHMSDGSLLHWAAELNLTGHLRFLLRDMSLPVNFQDIHRNTPLMAACATGHLKASLLLIEFGADVNATNDKGETALHSVWRFCDDDAMQLLHEFVKLDADFNRESFLSKRQTANDEEKDPLPQLPGKAIERVAGRGRINLVREFLQLKPLHGAAGAATLCRMIFWASLLSFPEMRDFLIQYCEDNKITGTASIDGLLCYPDGSVLPDKKRQRTFMGPVARGWLSGAGSGWMTPEIFWRMCCHGNQWESRLQKTIQSVSINAKQPLCNFEDILYFSFPMRHNAFSRVFLKLYIDEHAAPGAGNGRNLRHRCVKHKNPDKKWCGFDMGVRLDGPRNPTPFVERILFRNQKTLVQYAITLGNREVFSILVKDFDANVARPWSDTSAPNSDSTNPPERPAYCGKVYLNCYSLLALHSQDIWFAHEFQKLGISIDHLSPSQGKKIWHQRQTKMARRKPTASPTNSVITDYLPPLSHSLDTGLYQLATFLLDSGADLQEPVAVVKNVLDRALSPPVITGETVRLLFGHEGFHRKLDGGSFGPVHAELLPPDIFTPGNGRPVFDLIQKKYNKPQIPTPYQILSSAMQKSWYTFPKMAILLAGSRVCGNALRVIFNPLLALISYRCASGPLYAKQLENKFLFNPDQPEQASGNRLSLKKIWDILLLEFPEVDVSPRWCWRGLCPHRSRSLLALALTAPYNISEAKLWYIATSFYWGTTKTPHPFQCRGVKESCKNCSLHSHENSHVHSRMDSSVIEDTLSIYENTVTLHKPSLVDIFLWNDYDIVPPACSETLFDLGYRHSFLYFVEIRILSSIPMLFLFSLLIIYPISMTYSHSRSSISLSIWLVAFPAALGFSHLLVELVKFWSYWCESGNFLWPMITGKRRYTGYGMRQVSRAFVGVFGKTLAESAEYERLNLRAWS